MRRPPVSAVSVLATAVVVFVVAVVAVVVLTVRGGDDDGSGATAAGGDGTGGATGAGTPAVTTLADLAAADVVVRRDAFCDGVGSRAVAAALGEDDADAVTASSYDNGDLLPTDAVPGTGASVQAVAHEYGCSWTAADGTVARAWVFAPPVAPARAKRLGRSAERAEGCAAHTAEPFGDPTAAWTCTDATTATTTAGRSGLFGDAWLSCTLSATSPATGPAADATGLQARADTWCVAAADAASGSAG